MSLSSQVLGETQNEHMLKLPSKPARREETETSGVPARWEGRKEGRKNERKS